MPAPSSGQGVGTGLGNTVPLSAAPVSCTAFVLKAPLTNTGPVYIGPAGVTSTTGHQLDPGDEYVYERNSQNAAPLYQLAPSDFFLAAATGDKITWLVSP